MRLKNSCLTQEELILLLIRNWNINIQFAAEIADLYDTINGLHPFREGNGRTQRIFFTDLIREYGYDIQFTEDNVDFLMIATIQAAQGVLDYLIQFFTDEIVEPEEKQDFGMIL